MNIFEFVDYRAYITAWRLSEKEKNPGLTHEYLCRVLGQKNRSYFNDIEKGRKIIGSEVLDRFIKLFNLKGDEAKYFRALVAYGQPCTYEEKEYWFEQLIALNNTPKLLVEKSMIQYFTQWYHTCVRALLDTCDIRDDYDFISSKLYNRITANEAKESIRLLAALNLIAPDSNGYWKPTGKIISTGDNFKDELLKRYYVTNNDILHEILKRDIPGTHDSSLLTISVSDIGLERIVKRIKQLRSEIIAIANKDVKSSDRVYQIAVHAFPLSKKD
jgi:uncharacterized protein (TIGR02147 family)